ncbi:MAG TPA: hypothetical protein VJ863_11320 [Sphaerochaeta sp.]|nr:hypothetical protein [Sphaerochaeta sp.]
MSRLREQLTLISNIPKTTRSEVVIRHAQRRDTVVIMLGSAR